MEKNEVSLKDLELIYANNRLTEYLTTLSTDELSTIKSRILCDDIIGIWSQLELVDDYPMNRTEKELINNICEMLKLEIDKFSVYKYGLYVSSVVGSIKGISYKKINKIYEELPIYSRKDINIKAMDIAKILNRVPGDYLSDILLDIEREIIMGNIDNEYDSIVRYIAEYYFDLEAKVDAIVFTAGVLENNVLLREDIIQRLSKPMGVYLNKDINEKIGAGGELDDGLITTKESLIPVFVMPTNEEVMIIRDTYNIIKNSEIKKR